MGENYVIITTANESTNCLVKVEPLFLSQTLFTLGFSFLEKHQVNGIMV